MNTKFHFSTILIPALAMAVLVSACSSTVNWNYPRTPSTAFAQPQTTTLGALFQEAAEQHPSSSGFSLMREGERAFMARLAMADLAEKSLDAQYYIWEGDTTGLILTDHLLRAADRGVHVRVRDWLFPKRFPENALGLAQGQPDMEALVKNTVLWEKLEAPVNKELGVMAKAK
jgi:hypothetical protein